jgi:hypothetical protein
MSFKVMTTRASGIVKSVMQFNTCHGNGMYGTLTPPHMLRGMLKEEKHNAAVIEYVKKYLPAAHPLVQKGFKRLPRGVDTVAAQVAVEVGSGGEE